MKRILSLFIGVIGTLGLVVQAASSAALYVYAVNRADDTYVYPPSGTPAENYPFMVWSQPNIAAHLSHTPPLYWVPSDQYLIVRTDELYNPNVSSCNPDACTQEPCTNPFKWTIQIYTDNLHKTEGQSHNFPDHWAGPDCANGGPNCHFVAGGTSSHLTTPVYQGYQSIRLLPGQTNVTTDLDTNHYPKSGLISQDNAERAPLVWRVQPRIYNPERNSINNNFEGIVEGLSNKGAYCGGFQNCAWHYTRDIGDFKGNQCKPDGTGPGCISDWPTPSNQDFWYPSFMTNCGEAWGVGPTDCDGNESLDGYYCPPLPQNVVSGETHQYVYVAANMRNATRQIYSSTIFVELMEF